MAHIQQLKFIEIVNKYFIDEMRLSNSVLRIVEIGSFNVNGSPRSFLEDEKTDYVGVDLCEGSGVDIVSYGHSLQLPTGAVDFCLSCECFEHDPNWLETFKNMYRMTRPGGIVAFTCASVGRLEHGTMRTSADHSPGTQFIGLDYYKNLTQDDFLNVLDMHDLFDEYYFFYEKSSYDLYFVGRKANGQKKSNNIDFCKEVAQIKSLYKFRPKLVNLPVYLARLVLSENAFQDFSAKYLNKVKPFREFIKSMFK
ncbi:MAG: hypothetical protein RLY43_2408 [Bacteroidota bacterium]|jgi:SAM-dependent methyltransferase